MQGGRRQQATMARDASHGQVPPLTCAEGALDLNSISCVIHDIDNALQPAVMSSCCPS